MMRLILGITLAGLLMATLVTVPLLQYPEAPIGLRSTHASTAWEVTAVIDDTAEKYAVIFRAPKTGEIQKIHFHTGTVTVNAASVIRVSLQDVSLTTGNPDGTQDQYADISGASITSNTVIVSGNLSANRSVTMGDFLALVVEYQTFTASDSIQFRELNQWSGGYSAFPGQTYRSLYTASWAKSGIVPAATVIYSDDSYAQITNIYPVSALGISSVFNSGTDPDEIALRFSLPFPCRVVGAWFAADIDGDTDVVLYGPSTVSMTVDKDARSSSATPTYAVFFPSASVLVKDTQYHLALKPTSATSITLTYWDAPTVAAMAGLPGGASLYWAQRVDAGAWSYTTTRRPMIGLLIDQLDDGAAGGGGGAAMPTVISQ